MPRPRILEVITVGLLAVLALLLTHDFWPVRLPIPSESLQTPRQMRQVVVTSAKITPEVSPSAIPDVPLTYIPTAQLLPIPTSTPTPVKHQTTTIDDSIQGTSVNQFNYVGSSWRHCTGGCNGTGGDCYNGSWTLDSTAGDYMTVSFTGIQIQFYAVTGTYGGIGAISLDGGRKAMVNFYSVSLLGDQLMWTSPMLPTGSHTFKLRVTGTKGDPSSKDSEVGIDRVDILS